jgi:hypothetical protein
MPAPVGRRAGQPSRVAGNARERRYSEAVAWCRRHAPALGTRGPPQGRRRRSGRSATSWTGVRSRRTLRLRASLAGDGQCARWLESLSRCRMGRAGAVSSALPWVAQPPSEQCANSWRGGVALSTVGCTERNSCGPAWGAAVAGTAVCSARRDGGTRSCFSAQRGLRAWTVARRRLCTRCGCHGDEAANGRGHAHCVGLVVQDSWVLQRRGFWCSFSCKWGCRPRLDSNSSSSLLYFSCMPQIEAVWRGLAQRFHRP